MSDNQSTHLPRVEEISTGELIRAIIHRRWWVVASITVCLAAGIAYLLLKAPVYEANATLRIGQVAGAGPFEPAEVLASRLLAEHGEKMADGVRRARPFLARAAVQRGTPSTVELVAEAYRPADAVDFLNRVLGEVQQSHAATYRRNVDSLTQRLENLEAQRVALLRQYEEATVLLERLRVLDPVQASLLTLERSRISGLISALDTERPSLTLRLTPPQTQLTVTLGEIVPPVRAASPRRALVLGLAALLGIVVGTALALAVDFAGRPRPRAA